MPCRPALSPLLLILALWPMPALGATITQLTDTDDFDESEPGISGSNVVWMGCVREKAPNDCEIYLWDGIFPVESIVTQLSDPDNGLLKANPYISGSNVVLDRPGPRIVVGCCLVRETALAHQRVRKELAQSEP